MVKVAISLVKLGQDLIYGQVSYPLSLLLSRHELTEEQLNMCRDIRYSVFNFLTIRNYEGTGIPYLIKIATYYYKLMTLSQGYCNQRFSFGFTLSYPWISLRCKLFMLSEGAGVKRPLRNFL